MRGVNKAIIVGSLGADPEIRSTGSGGVVANLSIATSEQWIDKQSGEKQERTEWHRVVMFNRLGEIARDYLRKGSQVYVEGKIQTNKWQDSSGQDRYTTSIVASDMQMLGGGGQGGVKGAQGNRSGNGNQGSQGAHRARQQDRSDYAKEYAKQSGGSVPNDDVPF